MRAVFDAAKPEAVLHLAAQAGVRYSLENPMAYVETNLVGFANLLECCRRHPPRHLVFASSSSVYGANTELPWSESQNVDHPVSLYAATKKSNELMAHVYSHLFGLNATGLRYFTVYGPWGRPDMSPMLFARAIMEGQPIQVFNHGDMQRDFTYIDDIVEGTLRVLDRPTPLCGIQHRQSPAGGAARLHRRLESALGKKARLEMKPMQPGDVKATYADTDALSNAVGFAPGTPLAQGLAEIRRVVQAVLRLFVRSTALIVLILSGCTIADEPYPLRWDPLPSRSLARLQPLPRRLCRPRGIRERREAAFAHA